MRSILERAVEGYSKSIEVLKGFSEYMDGLMKKAGKEFNPKHPLISFDIMLQYSFLQTALHDGTIAESEITFIEEITDFGDLCGYISAVTKVDISWAELYNSKESDVADFLNNFKPFIDSASSEFVALFATMDKATDHDYLQDLIENVSLMLTGLSAIDGSLSSDEATTDCLLFEVLGRISSMKNS